MYVNCRDETDPDWTPISNHDTFILLKSHINKLNTHQTKDCTITYFMSWSVRARSKILLTLVHTIQMSGVLLPTLKTASFTRPLTSAISCIVCYMRTNALTSKCCALPNSASHQLEGTCGNLLSSSCNSNDDTFSPSFVASLQGCPHDLNISNALEGVVTTTIGHLHQHFLDGALMVLWVDKLCAPKCLGWGQHKNTTWWW